MKATVTVTDLIEERLRTVEVTITQEPQYDLHDDELSNYEKAEIAAQRNVGAPTQTEEVEFQ